LGEESNMATVKSLQGIHALIANHIGENSTVDSSAHPKLESLAISRILNNINSTDSVYVLDMMKSFDSPHMVDYRSYKRKGATSVPIDNVRSRVQWWDQKEALRCSSR
jgi:hypothetical protein